jgi:hypothetical protein
MAYGKGLNFIDESGILSEMRSRHSIVLTVTLTLLHPARPYAGAEFSLVTFGTGTLDMGSDSGDGDDRPGNIQKVRNSQFLISPITNQHQQDKDLRPGSDE